jgi:hypothetical protein
MLSSDWLMKEVFFFTNSSLVDERGIFFYQFFVFSAFPPLLGYLPKNIPVL